MFDIGVWAMQFDESSIVKQASPMLCTLLAHSDWPQLVNLVQQKGVPAMQQLFERLKFETQTSVVEFSADVMWTVAKSHPAMLAQFISALPPHPLVQAMFRELANKRRFREFAKRLNTACRKEQLKL